MVVGRQLHRDPLAEGRRAFAHIHRNITDFSLHHAHQLALGIFHLVMQPTQHTFDRARVVVLDEYNIHARLPGELTGVECLEEKTTAVTENLRLDDQYFRDCGRDDVHSGSLARCPSIDPSRPRWNFPHADATGCIRCGYGRRQTGSGTRHGFPWFDCYRSNCA
ncbi:hypothetical protein D3C80_1556730 [compost metagenome]